MERDKFYSRIKDMKERIKNSSKRKGVLDIHLPGERKAKTKAERLNKGITLSADVVEELKKLAEENNIEWSFN